MLIKKEQQQQQHQQQQQELAKHDFSPLTTKLKEKEQ